MILILKINLFGREKFKQSETAKLRQASVNLVDNGEQFLAESYLPRQLADWQLVMEVAGRQAVLLAQQTFGDEALEQHTL